MQTTKQTNHQSPEELARLRQQRIDMFNKDAKPMFAETISTIYFGKTGFYANGRVSYDGVEFFQVFGYVRELRDNFKQLGQVTLITGDRVPHFFCNPYEPGDVLFVDTFKWEDLFGLIIDQKVSYSGLPKYTPSDLPTAPDALMYVAAKSKL